MLSDAQWFDLVGRLTYLIYKDLVSSENIASIYFILHIIQTSIVAVGNDGLALWFEGKKVVDYFAAEEGGAIF